MTKSWIQSEWIKLDSFLKYSGACETGGEAKLAVQHGEVLVNGDICIQRGKKLVPGDQISINGSIYEVCRR